MRRSKTGKLRPEVHVRVPGVWELVSIFTPKRVNREGNAASAREQKFRPVAREDFVPLPHKGIPVFIAGDDNGHDLRR